MSNGINVTIDDFDSLISWSNYGDWQTPNPQDNPSWYNATEEVTGSPWHEATIHYTVVSGAAFSLNFTASSIWIYGSAGATNETSYLVDIDGTTSSHTTTNVTDGRSLLYSDQGLEYGAHQINVTNQGSGLGLDLIVYEVDVGTGLTNTTLDETSSSITYEGSWTSETGSFYNGSSIYTQGPNNSFSFNFTGSALYLYGDIVNDHGPFSIYFNGSNTPYGTYNSRSGCGAEGYEKGCEKLGVLKAFVGNLPMGQHSFKLVNEGFSEGNLTYFDFDYAEWTTPTTYPSYSIDATCAYGTCDGSASTSSTSTTGTATGTATSTSPSSGSTSSTSAGESLQVSNGIGILMLCIWVLGLVKMV